MRGKLSQFNSRRERFALYFLARRWCSVYLFLVDSEDAASNEKKNKIKQSNQEEISHETFIYLSVCVCKPKYSFSSFSCPTSLRFMRRTIETKSLREFKQKKKMSLAAATGK